MMMIVMLIITSVLLCYLCSNGQIQIQRRGMLKKTPEGFPLGPVSMDDLGASDEGSHVGQQLSVTPLLQLLLHQGRKQQAKRAAD